MGSATTYRYLCADGHSGIIVETRNHAEGPPTYCKLNPAHGIIPDSLAELYTIKENTVVVTEETSGTNGIFETVGFFWEIPAGVKDTVFEFRFDWPYPVSIINVGYNAALENVGDRIEFLTIPLVQGGKNDGTIGILSSHVSVGQTVIPVPLSVAMSVLPGFMIYLQDGVQTNCLGRVISTDYTSSIVMSTPTTHSFNEGSTLIKLRIPRLSNWWIAREGLQIFGAYKFGTSDLPTGTEVLVKYTLGQTCTQPKHFQAYAEITF